MQLVPVASHGVKECWDWIEPEIARVLARTGRFTPESILKGLEAQDYQLWLAVENGELFCACVTEIIDFPLVRVCNVFLAAGKDAERWQCYMLDLQAWAKENGCQKMETLVRPGFGRLLKKIILNLRIPHHHLEWDIG